MKKMLLIMLAVTVSVAMIAAATMAWFTDQAEADGVTFTAGTVEIEVEGENNFGEAGIENVNPGDIYELEWTIINTGSKKMTFMVEPEAEYSFVGDTDFRFDSTSKYYNGETMDNLRIGFKDVKWNDSTEYMTYYFVEHGESAELLKTPNWTIVYRGDEVDTNIEPNSWLYYKDFNNFNICYTGEPLEAGEDIDLVLVIEFVGEDTGNDYQGAEFVLDGTVTAVQATNGAPAAELDADVYANYNYSNNNSSQTESYD